MVVKNIALMAALSLFCVFGRSVGQNRDWTYDIPAAGIVEDLGPIDNENVRMKDWVRPGYSLIYRLPLPVPPVKEPTQVFTNLVFGNEIWYFEVDMRSFSRAVCPNLHPAKLVGYDGMSPGPTFLIPRGTESIVRSINNAGTPNSVHLHGSYSRAPFDGWADDLTQLGEFKDYYYPNQQNARLLWHHDHAVHITAENAYFEHRGNRGVMAYESAGLGDVVWLGKEETVIAEGHYAPWTGLYMFHCHNLISKCRQLV